MVKTTSLHKYSIALFTPESGCQKRFYTPPSKRTWSKQHEKIRTLRPLVDTFAMSKLHPEKEWWKERQQKPATFMGFPDVSKHSLRGGSLYIEQMDPVTLSVILDKCVTEQIFDHSMWSAFCWQAQRMSNTTVEPSLGHIYKSFAQADWYDGYFIITLLGRIQRRMHMFMVSDCANVIHAMSNPRFRNDKVVENLLEHVELLLRNRDDVVVEDICALYAAVRACNVAPVGMLRAAAVHLDKCDWRVLDISYLSEIIYSVACLHQSFGRSVLPQDTIWRIIRELEDRCHAFRKNAFFKRERREVRDNTEEITDNLGKKTLITSGHRNSCAEAVLGVFEKEDIAKVVTYLSVLRMSRTSLVKILAQMCCLRRPEMECWELATCVNGFSRLGIRDPGLFRQLSIGVREQINHMPGSLIAQTLQGFLRATREYSTVQDVVIPRLVECLDDLDVEALSTIYDGVSRCNVSDWEDPTSIDDVVKTADMHSDPGVDLDNFHRTLSVLASNCVRRIHRQLPVATAGQLGRIAHSTTRLEPDDRIFMSDLISTCFTNLHNMDDSRLGMLLLCLGSQDETTFPEKYDLLSTLVYECQQRWLREGGLLHQNGARCPKASVVLLQALKSLARSDVATLDKKTYMSVMILGPRNGLVVNIVKRFRGTSARQSQDVLNTSVPGSLSHCRLFFCSCRNRPRPSPKNCTTIWK
eukprot:GHVQ01017019.1.p1 GENE.GHVQ01017019.1~~GHVQ01017019.1.p1  ORF type:complete len:697 (+),score=56.57 GHVQ01017019.1:174-2264(+)